jgi:hypothetical protein
MGVRVILDLDDYVGPGKDVESVEDLAAWLSGGLGGVAFEAMAADIRHQADEQADQPIKPSWHPPSEAWFGTTEHQWPVHVFPTERSAVQWLKGQELNYRRHIWKAKVVDVVEYRFVQPEPYVEPVQ